MQTVLNLFAQVYRNHQHIKNKIFCLPSIAHLAVVRKHESSLLLFFEFTSFPPFIFNIMKY